MLNRYKTKQIIEFYLVILILLPIVGWIIVDRSIWPWDKGDFAMQTVELANWLLNGELKLWFERLIDTTPYAPPLSIWVTQFFVLLAWIKIPISQAILFGNLFFTLLSLILGIKILKNFQNKKINYLFAPALLSIPLIQGIVRSNFNENLQLTITLLTIYIWSNLILHRYTLSEITIKTIIVLNLLVLVKIAAIFFVSPFLIYIIFKVFFDMDAMKQIKNNFKFKKIYITVMCILTALSFLWYRQNLSEVLKHTQDASNPIWKTNLNLYQQLHFWLSLLLRNAKFLFISSIIIAIITIIKIFLNKTNHNFRKPSNDIKFLLTLSVTILLQAAIIVKMDNSDPRFLFIPLSLLSLWACQVVSYLNKWIISIFFILCTINSINLGVNALIKAEGSYLSDHFTVANNQDKVLKDIKKTLIRYCRNDNGMQPHYLYLGANTTYINEPSWNMWLRKLQFIDKSVPLNCQIIGTESNPFFKTRDGLEIVTRMKPKFYISVPPSKFLSIWEDHNSFVPMQFDLFQKLNLISIPQSNFQQWNVYILNYK